MAIAPGESLLDRFVVETVFRGDSASLNRLEKRVAAFRAKLDGVSSGMLRMGAVFAAPLAGIAKGAITTDSAFRQLAAVGGFAEDQMRRFKEQAYEVGSALPLETAAILDTQRALVKLGFAYEDVLKMTPQVAKASVAAKVPIDEMAKFVGVAVKAFGLAGDEIDLLADQMVRIENISAASTRGVGQAFQYSAQIASDAGVRIEDYIAILGGMADAGREVEASSQGLGLFITNIQKARAGDMTRGAAMIKKVFGAIGIEMDEVAAIMDDPDVGLIGLLRRISHATAGDMSKLDAVLAQLGGTSYAAALSAAVQNIDHIEYKLSHDLVNATGEAAGQVNILMQGISGAWEQAKAMLDTLVNRLADLGVAGRFEKLFMGFANLLNELLEMDSTGKLVNERFLKMAIDIMFWGSSLLVAGLALKVVSFALSGFIGIIKVAQALLWTLSAAFTAVKISATLAAGAVRLLWRAVFGLPGVLAGVAYSFLKTTGHWDAMIADMRQKWDVFVDDVQGADWSKEGFAERFKNRWAEMREQWGKDWTALKQDWGDVVTWFTGLWDKHADKIIAIGSRIATVFRPFTRGAAAVGTFLGLAENDLEAGEDKTVATRIVDTIDGGVEDADAQTLVRNVETTLEPVEELLPQSDARRGPLSRLTAAGAAIVPTITEGVQQVGSHPLTVTLTHELQSALGAIMAPLQALSLDFPDFPGFPDVPAFPGLPSFPGLPALPGLPEFPELPAFPDLPALQAAVQPLPVGPTQQQFDALKVDVPAQAGAQAKPVTRDVKLSIDRIEIKSDASDPREVASQVGQEIGRQLRILVEQADSNISV